MDKKSVLLGIIIAFSAIGIYDLATNNEQPITKPSGSKMVTKVIDGDTLLVEGEHVRLLGIDADETGYECHDAARDGLESYVLGREVFLEADQQDTDQYGRYLRYVFLDGMNINLRLVEDGLAVARFFPENEKYKAEIIAAEGKARENNIGCKWALPGEWTALTGETGLSIVQACDAANYRGEEIIVEGTIADTYRHGTTALFLNFGRAYPDQCFTAVIWSDDWHRFPEDAESRYKGKTVRARGTVTEYQGRAEIILDDPSRIETVS